MTITKLAGLFFIMLPFAGVTAYAVRDQGWRVTLAIFGTVGLLIGSLTLGVFLFFV